MRKNTNKKQQRKETNFIMKLEWDKLQQTTTKKKPTQKQTIFENKCFFFL